MFPVKTGGEKGGELLSYVPHSLSFLSAERFNRQCNVTGDDLPLQQRHFFWLLWTESWSGPEAPSGQVRSCTAKPSVCAN